MTNIKILTDEIDSLKDRNRKVEADKAWETSTTRKLLIAFLTYIVVLIFFLLTEIERPFFSALVPTIGFIFSTLGLSAAKQIWIDKVFSKKIK